MNATQHQSDPFAMGDLHTGPGEHLRTARRSTGQSVAEVAAKLHLDPKTVRHIEADEYTALPAPAFVRGYLRSYARILGIPPGPVIEAYDRNGFEPPALTPEAVNQTTTEGGDFPVRLVTHVVIAVLFALLIVWWHNQHFNEVPPVSDLNMGGATLATSNRPASTASAAIPTPATDHSTGNAAHETSTGKPSAAPAAQVASVPHAPAAGANGPATNAVPPPTQAAAETAADEGAVATQASPAGAGTVAARTAPPSPSSSSRAAAARTTGTPTPAPTAGTGATAKPTMDVLTMKFDHESWVEVYNAAGEKLFYNLVSAGQHVKVQGHAPFRVLLGYARGVDIKYNGKPFDQAPYISKEIARFTLGAKDAHASGATDQTADQTAEATPGARTPSP